MWLYQKTLQHPVNIKNMDLKMAKYLITQFGGPNGELAASIRYLSQRYTMPTGKTRALLTDIGTEELAHVEMICTMVYQLMKGATIDELKAAGLDAHYADHGVGLYPVNGNGIPWTATYFSTTGDPVADISENMAAEEKARAVYENLMNLTDNIEILTPLEWLRQREIVHFNRFKELYEEYKMKGYK